MLDSSTSQGVGKRSRPALCHCWHLVQVRADMVSLVLGTMASLMLVVVFKCTIKSE